MGRYIIDESCLNLERSKVIVTQVLNWAVPRADAFMLTLDPTIYTSSVQYDRIATLGEQSVGSNALHKTITGRRPPPFFVEIVIAEIIPAHPISSDLTCVEDITLYRDGIRFYALFDYGRTQLLDIDTDALAELRHILDADAGVLIPAPVAHK